MPDRGGRTHTDPLYDWPCRLQTVESDEFPDPIASVPLACGHLGVVTVSPVFNTTRYWCPVCVSYFDRKGE